MNENLDSLYYDLPRESAYAGADKLLLATRKKYKPRSVIEWLESQDAYNMHKIVRRRFNRRGYNVRNIDDIWEADLIDFESLKSYNDAYTYLLTVIDVISKYVWIEPIVNKTSKNVAMAFERILSRSNGRQPVCLQTDKGKEFIGREMQEFLKQRNIVYRVVRSPDVKAAIVERFIRTVKERIWRYFTHNNTRRYIDVLQSIVEAYNQSKHTTTKMTPASVTLHNAAKARQNIDHRYFRERKIRTPKYKIGELVRVSRARNVFAKGYEGGWTLELFKIARISSTRYPTVYFLKDLADEEIDGYFYEEELSRVRKDLDNAVFEVEKILKTRGKGSSKEYYVHWKGYPDKFRSWVKDSCLKQLQ